MALRRHHSHWFNTKCSMSRRAHPEPPPGSALGPTPAKEFYSKSVQRAMRTYDVHSRLTMQAQQGLSCDVPKYGAKQRLLLARECHFSRLVFALDSYQAYIPRYHANNVVFDSSELCTRELLATPDSGMHAVRDTIADNHLNQRSVLRACGTMSSSPIMNQVNLSHRPWLPNQHKTPQPKGDVHPYTIHMVAQPSGSSRV